MGLRLSGLGFGCGRADFYSPSGDNRPVRQLVCNDCKPPHFSHNASLGSKSRQARRVLGIEKLKFWGKYSLRDLLARC